jgi:UDP-N-acetylglucosamine 4-epimerase
VRDADAVRAACAGAELVLHQAGAGSVPRSLAEPARAVSVNAEGTWTLLAAARAAGAERLVLASSSSVYGDRAETPQREDRIGRPLSPYAASKRTAELAAEGFARSLGFPVVALRYFNVFGPRQDPDGPYAAVIPRWCAALRAGRAPVLHGDGAHTRDFTPVPAVVAANLLAAVRPLREPFHVLNVGTGRELSLAELLARLTELCARSGGTPRAPERTPERPLDRRASRADVERARELLGYEPPSDIEAELRETWLRSR